MKAPPAENGKHVVYLGTFQDVCVGHPVLPSDVQNALEASQVEAVEFPLVVRVCGPYLTTVEDVLSTQAW